MKSLYHRAKPIPKSLVTSALLVVMAAGALAQNDAPSAEPKIEGDKVAGLNLPDVRVQDLLKIYEKLADKPIIYDTSVQGSLSIDTDIAVNKAEARRLIEVALITNNFSIVVREHEIRVLGPGKPTRSASVPIYFDEKSIPQGESIISFAVELKHADPGELANMLNNYLATGQPYTNFLPMPGGRGLLITESVSTIRNILPLIRKIDVEGYERAEAAPQPPDSTPPGVDSPELPQAGPTQAGGRRRRLLSKPPEER